MPNATYVVTDFLGGELSQFAEGRFDKPDYKKSLRTCLNAFPVEAGAWMRRPPTMDAGTTLNGAPGRVIEFDFKQASPVTCEHTDGNLRFRSGTALVGGTLTTPYVGGSWANIRAVQAETTQILLNGSVAPQALVAASPTSFSLNPATFNDGPYLDPFTNGVQAVPSAKVGIITLQLQFPAYDSAKAYKVGDFITSSAVNYESLIDQNVGNTPVSSPSDWAPVAAGAAINNGQGFLGTDIGRSVRLFSEPAPWAVGTTYAANAIVYYDPTGQPGQETYWKSLTSSNTGNIPGDDVVNWSLLTNNGAAVWTWGRITGLSNIIDRALSGSASIGSMTGGGGLNSAFDGNFSKVAASGAELLVTGTMGGPTTSLTGYVGKNYSGASNQKIMQATIYPSSDAGFSNGSFTTSFGGGPVTTPFNTTITFHLRGKASAPSSSSDGTLLGTQTLVGNSFSPITIVSGDQSTAWAYVWVEMISVTSNGQAGSSYAIFVGASQLSFFSPPGSGVGNAVNIEILGPALLYTTPILNWRLGVYSNTTGWPTCGVYYDGRIWLGGAVDNRADACYANGIVGGTINFAPTDQYGVVTDAHAISATFNSDSVNPLLWMKPDLQGVLMGTQAAEWLVQAPTAGSISPLNISAKPVTHHGSEFIEPVRTEHTLVFVKRAARKLIEFFPDVFSGKFSAPNLADKAEHITVPGVAELAYTSAVTPIIWGRCNDGSFFGLTYKRDSLASSQPPTFYGWHRHALGSGRVVESICAGASVGGDLDALTMVTNDPASNIRRVEILMDTPSQDTDISDACYLDSAINPTVAIGANNVTLSGLPWVDGTVVQVFAGGLDLGDRGDALPRFDIGKTYGSGAQVTGPDGQWYTSQVASNKGFNPPSDNGTHWLLGGTDYTVASGAVTVPYGDSISNGPGAGFFTQAFASGLSASQFVVGFAFNSDGEIVKPMLPVDSGSRTGPAFGLIQRSHRLTFQLINSQDLMFGPSFAKLQRANFKNASESANWPRNQGYSGLHGETSNSDFSRNDALCFRAARSRSLIVTQLALNLASMDQ